MAALLVLGTGLALLGMVVVGAAVPASGDADTTAGAWGGAALTVAGFVLVVLGLLRWLLRTRASARKAAARPAAPAVA